MAEAGKLTFELSYNEKICPDTVLLKILSYPRDPHYIGQLHAEDFPKITALFNRFNEGLQNVQQEREFARSIEAAARTKSA